MNKTIKKKWIEALESDKYRKGKGRLKSNDGSYCCLGVLCDILDKGEWTHHYDYKYQETNYPTYLPPKLASAIHLSINTQFELSRLNDKNDTFTPIIKMIKEIC
jgi:hypothetical protein